MKRPGRDTRGAAVSTARREVAWAALMLIVLTCRTGAGAIGREAPPSGAPIPTRRSSSSIALTAGGATLLVANPDSNSLTLIDAGRREVVAEIGVGLDPRTVAVDGAGDWAYTANRGGDSVSVVDLHARRAVAEIAVGSRPYGLVLSPDGRRLYVAVQGSDRLVILDTARRATIAQVPTADRPSGLALGDDGRTLYITHLLTNTVTVLTVQPHTLFLPFVYHTTLSAQTAFPGETALRTSRWLSSTLALWPDSNLVQSIVLAPAGTTAYIPHTRSNTTNQALTFDTTVFPLVSLVDLQTRQHLVGRQIDLGTLDPPGVGLPFDAALTPDGRELWVVNAGSNDLSVIEVGPPPRLAAHIEVGHNPRGIALSTDGTTAYVNNTLGGTVSVVDTASYAVVDTIAATEIPLPPTLLNGKRLFHSSDDPRLARAQWISCNTCHYEGEHDGRTWTFGFAGPRNTTSLLGMVETYPLRWSGEWNESADSEFVVRKENFGSGLIEGEMNCAPYPPDCVHQPPNSGRSYDLDCLAAFLDSLAVPLSPSHARGEPLTAAEARGQAIFHRSELACVTCHPPPLYTDQQAHDVGTATAGERIGPAYDTPTLRGLYDSAPYFHDGSAATLYETLIRPSPGNEHDVRGQLTEAEIEDLIAFLLALPFEQ